MSRRNIDKTYKKLEQHPKTENVHVDASSSEVIFRAIVEELTEDQRLPEDVESFLESIPGVEIEKDKYLGFCREVTLR